MSVGYDLDGPKSKIVLPLSSLYLMHHYMKLVVGLTISD